MMIVIVMGVCGSGKTSVGTLLASKLCCEFADADDFHPKANKEKMTRGHPLTDEDRTPWLLEIRQFIQRMIDSNKSAVVTCSALKRSYRDVLAAEDVTGLAADRRLSDVVFLYLKGPERLLRERIGRREGHFMPATLLASQLQTLEEPSRDERHIVGDVSDDLQSLVDKLYQKLVTTPHG